MPPGWCLLDGVVSSVWNAGPFRAEWYLFRQDLESRALSLCLIKCRHTFFYIRLRERGDVESQGALLTDKTEYSQYIFWPEK